MKFGLPWGKDEAGIALLRAKKYEEALIHFANRHKAHPAHSEPIIEVAKIYFHQQKYNLVQQWLLRLNLQEIGEREIHQIVDMTNFRKLSSENHFNSSPCFSPDGKWIAFTSIRRDTNGNGKVTSDDNPGLYLVNVETGKEIEISSDHYFNDHPVFSADGKYIAYLSAREDSNGDGKIDHSDDPGLYLKELSSGAEKCVVEARFRPKYPSFSPNGQLMLFCAWQTQSSVCGIYLTNLQRGTLSTVHSVYQSNYPIFSPNGSQIVYASWRKDTNGDGQIDLRDNSGLYEYFLQTGAEQLLVSDEYSNSYASFSPNGESIVYLSRRRDTNDDGVINSLDNSGIYTFDIKHRKEKLVISDESYNKFPCFSHDGEKILFIGSWVDEKKKDLHGDTEYFDNKGVHVVDINGHHAREAVSSKYYGSRFLSVSPNSHQVAYVSWRKDTNRGLYLAPYDRLPTPQELKTYIEKNF